jgi:YbbR domain-containing protein
MKLNNVIQSILFNWPAKIVCIVLACLLYFLVQTINLDVREIETSLQLRLPEGYAVEENYVKTVTVTMRGAKDAIYTVLPEHITAVADFTYIDGPGIYTAAVKVLRSEDILTDAPLEISSEPERITLQIASDREHEENEEIEQIEGGKSDET